MDFTDNGAEQTLQWVLGQGTPAPPAGLWIALHLGDPGADGTGNPAINTERQPATWQAITSPGIPPDGSADALTTGTITWLALPATEQYSHISLWDAVTGGNAWYKGALIAPVTVLAGGSFEFQNNNGLLRHQ